MDPTQENDKGISRIMIVTTCHIGAGTWDGVSTEKKKKCTLWSSNAFDHLENIITKHLKDLSC